MLNRYLTFSSQNEGIMLKKNNIKFTTILYLILHVSIIVIFEILFYFLYIIKKEYQVFDYLIKDVTKTNNNYFDNNTKYLINKIIKEAINMNMTNLEYINNKALEDRSIRLNEKNLLFHKSLVILIFFVILSLFTINFGLYHKKIKLKYLILDLFIMLSMIAVFEFIFFTKIVSHIRPISPYELLNNIISVVDIKY
tara:strand:+ start:221 stop:808 length:588 start_codon:yes stop_codon:yes gene_type:complete